MKSIPVPSREEILATELPFEVVRQDLERRFPPVTYRHPDRDAARTFGDAAREILAATDEGEAT